MPYEDPIEAALRALTDVEWRNVRGAYEARINHTHLVGIQQSLEDYGIIASGEVSPSRSGRYIATVSHDDAPKILKAVQENGLVAKPHRRKRSKK